MFKFELPIKNLKQSSTWRGLALVGSAAAFALGYGHIFSAEMTAAGVQFGGIAGAFITAGVGLYDVIRDELKSVE